MSDTRMKNVNWELETGPRGVLAVEQAALAVLMDIRDELKKLNGLLHCQNFTAIPHKLDAIVKNTKKPIRKKKAEDR